MAIRMRPELRLAGPVAAGKALNSAGVVGKALWGKRASWVSYFGPAPSRYDPPPPPRAPNLVAPPPVGFYVRDPEPIPGPGPTSAETRVPDEMSDADSSGLAWLMDKVNAVLVPAPVAAAPETAAMAPAPLPAPDIAAPDLAPAPDAVPVARVESQPLQ